LLKFSTAFVYKLTLLLSSVVRKIVGTKI